MTSPQRGYSNVVLHDEMFRRVPWQSVTDGVEPQVCDYFLSRYFARMHEAETAEDVARQLSSHECQGVQEGRLADSRRPEQSNHPSSCSLAVTLVAQSLQATLEPTK